MGTNLYTTKAKNTLLMILLAIMAFNYVDGQVLAVVLQDVQHDLHASDTELGFLSGIGFAVFYATLGIPIARMADTGDRVVIIAVTTAIWSVFVMAYGVATDFMQLFLLRIGVAVGEAGCLPPAQSLLSDFFPRAERARAFAIYALGAPLSVVIGGFFAGWLDQCFGWRATFVVLGAPGLALAVFAWILLHEPRRVSSVGTGCTAEARVGRLSLYDVAAVLAKNRTFRHLVAANTTLYFFVSAVTQWQPTFLLRAHGFTPSEVGTWQLLIWGVTGTIGTYAAGFLIDRFIARNERRQLQLMSVSIALFGGLNAFVYLVADRYLAATLMIFAAPFYTGIIGPLFAVNQSVVSESMRASAAALMLFFANLFGMGLGIFATGVLSDALRSAYGVDSLRYSLLFLSLGFLWCAIHFWRASSTVEADIERAHRVEASEKGPDTLQSAVRS